MLLMHRTGRRAQRRRPASSERGRPCRQGGEAALHDDGSDLPGSRMPKRKCKTIAEWKELGYEFKSER